MEEIKDETEKGTWQLNKEAGAENPGALIQDQSEQVESS